MSVATSVFVAVGVNVDSGVVVGVVDNIIATFIGGEVSVAIKDFSVEPM